MKIKISNLQKLYVLNEILRDLVDEDIISEFTFGILMGSYCLCKGISLGSFDRKELGFDD